jgi:hypothetical protein
MVLRMTQPSESRIENQALADKISRLEATVQALTEKLEKEISRNAKFTLRQLDGIDGDVAELFDRIKHIEVKFFPNLARDIVRMYEIIGEDEDKGHNPLDSRKP